jgi:hypothetical protein
MARSQLPQVLVAAASSVLPTPQLRVGRTMWHRLVNPVELAIGSTRTARMLPNYALERSVNCWGKRAAGARTIIAPAARRPRIARTAQRGR